MSTTTFTSASNHAVKLWARKTFNDAVKATTYGKLTGTSDRSIVQVKDELKNNGDRVRFGLRTLPTGIGVQDSEVLEGNEESLDFRYFDLNLGQKRHAVSVELNLSAQRTMFDVQAEAKDAIGEWCEEYIDTTFFEYLSGLGMGATTSISKFHPRGVLGGNALLTPSSDRIIYGGTATAFGNITASDTMSLTVLDKLAERAKLASPTMRKGQFNGKNAWVLLMHPYQVTDLRSNTNTGQWYDIQKAILQGGGSFKDSPLASEALGIYRDIILVESTRVPTYTNAGAGSVKGARALFLGAQAAVVAHGKGTDDDGRMKVVTKTFDYDNQFGVSATFVWGMAKSRFDNQSDFATIAVDTAAAPHA